MSVGLKRGHPSDEALCPVEYVVTIHETFQTQVRLYATSQAQAKRDALDGLRRYPPDPPSYGDSDELPWSIRLSAVAAWRDA